MGLHSTTLRPLISHSVIRKKIRMAHSGCGATHNEDTLNFQARAVRHFCILFCGQYFSRKIPGKINWSKIFPSLEKILSDMSGDTPVSEMKTLVTFHKTKVTSHTSYGQSWHQSWFEL